MIVCSAADTQTQLHNSHFYLDNKKTSRKERCLSCNSEYFQPINDIKTWIIEKFKPERRKTNEYK